MKQTAVEWLAKELESYGDPQFCEITWKDLDSLVKQAKEMERDQLIMFGTQCMVEVEKESGLGSIKIYELYFGKTFKSE